MNLHNPNPPVWHPTITAAETWPELIDRGIERDVDRDINHAVDTILTDVFKVDDWLSKPQNNYIKYDSSKQPTIIDDHPCKCDTCDSCPAHN